MLVVGQYFRALRAPPGLRLLRPRGGPGQRADAGQRGTTTIAGGAPPWAMAGGQGGGGRPPVWPMPGAPGRPGGARLLAGGRASRWTSPQSQRGRGPPGLGPRHSAPRGPPPLPGVSTSPRGPSPEHRRRAYDRRGRTPPPVVLRAASTGARPAAHRGAPGLRRPEPSTSPSTAGPGRLGHAAQAGRPHLQAGGGGGLPRRQRGRQAPTTSCRSLRTTSSSTPTSRARRTMARDAWDSGMKTAVKVRGTMDNPGDRDQGWARRCGFRSRASPRCRTSRRSRADRWRFNLYRLEHLGRQQVEGQSFSPLFRRGLPRPAALRLAPLPGLGLRGSPTGLPRRSARRGRPGSGGSRVARGCQ